MKCTSIGTAPDNQVTNLGFTLVGFHIPHSIHQGILPQISHFLECLLSTSQLKPPNYHLSQEHLAVAAVHPDSTLPPLSSILKIVLAFENKKDHVKPLHPTTGCLHYSEKESACDALQGQHPVCFTTEISILLLPLPPLSLHSYSGFLDIPPTC